jgi:prophage antirepressor-like protein
MNDLKIFKNSEFGELNILIKDGKEYFPATDCAKILGYKNPRKAILDHCKGSNEMVTPSKGGKQLKKHITESDLYRLIVKSKLPSAERFEKWIFEEVLPSIRKYGAYLTPEKIEEVLLNPDTIIKLATNLKSEQEKSKKLQLEIGDDNKNAKYSYI